jgi:hypothetical protein
LGCIFLEEEGLQRKTNIVRCQVSPPSSRIAPTFAAAASETSLMSGRAMLDQWLRGRMSINVMVCLSIITYDVESDTISFFSSVMGICREKHDIPRLANA